jgi:enediyne biosynthesis protein E4
LTLKTTLLHLLIWLQCGLLAAYAQGDTTASAIRFEDVTEPAGLHFRHQDGSYGQLFLPEHMGAGICTFDADNDGRLDVYFLNGSALQGGEIEPPPSNAFFRNLGEFRFREFTEPAGLHEYSYSLGVTAADFNNDGFQDLYISNFGKNTMLMNNGDGTFTDVTKASGVGDGSKFGAGVTFLDIDGDGNLDLFVANYVDFDYERHFRIAPTAFPYSPGPKDYAPTPDTLFYNNGDGTFRDISVESGIGQVAGPSMGIVAGDFDADNDIDIMVACDGAPNLLYLNNGQGEFAEEAVLAGVALDSRGIANGSMGAEAADLFNNGLLDILITDYSDQQPELYRNLPPGGIFEESSRLTQVGTEVYPHVNWGLGLIDFDCDGDKDVFICNGHLLENAKDLEPNTDYGVHNTVMENLANRTFRSVTKLAGPALMQARSSRGAAFDDLDADGNIDVVIHNCDAEAQVLRNTQTTDNSWIILDLKGTTTNRDAIGAKVWVSSGARKQFSERLNGRGYQSHYGSGLHFGLGRATSIERIEVTWPGGEVERTILENVPVNQRLTIIQGQ